MSIAPVLNLRGGAAIMQLRRLSPTTKATTPDGGRESRFPREGVGMNSTVPGDQDTAELLKILHPPTETKGYAPLGHLNQSGICHITLLAC